MEKESPLTPSTPVSPSPLGAGNSDHASELDQISQNLEAVLSFYSREEEKISYWQRLLERISFWMGQPAFFGCILLVVLLWILSNQALHYFGRPEFDPAPFNYLQGVIGLAALLTSAVVLIRQNRLGKLDEQRAHLDLKVTLLTEQKVAKLIELLEELRQDLPNVKNRHDLEAVALTQSMGPGDVLAALDERSNPDKNASVHGGIDTGNSEP